MPKEARRAPQETRKQVHRREREEKQKRTLYYALGGVAALIALVLGVGYYQETFGKLNAPIAKVNDKIITVREFQQSVRFAGGSLLSQINQITSSLSQASTDPSMAFLRDYMIQQYQQLATQMLSLPRDQLEQLIDDEMVRQETAKRNITVSADEVDQEIEREFNYQRATPTPTVGPSPTATNTATPTLTPTITPTFTPSPTPTGTITPTTPTLTPTPGPTDLPAPTATIVSLQGYQDQKKKFLDSLTKNAQMSEQDYRRQVEIFLLRQKFQVELAKTVPTTAEQIQARHILVADYATALQAEERLSKGEDFAKLAGELSQDTGSKVQGGDLGWIVRGQTVKEFEDAAFALQPNQISQPVTSTFGVHIIQVTARDPNRVLDEQALQAKKSTVLSEWLKTAKFDAKVERFYDANLVPVEIRNAIATIQQQTQ